MFIYYLKMKALVSMQGPGLPETAVHPIATLLQGTRGHGTTYEEKWHPMLIGLGRALLDGGGITHDWTSWRWVRWGRTDVGALGQTVESFVLSVMLSAP
jgi:hypothetical protein